MARADAATGAGGRSCIFMLHSVVEDHAAYFGLGNYTSARFLDRALGHYRARGFAFLSLAQAIERLREGSGGKFIAVTLDDGYRDNFTVALPIFRRHACPFTVFITTSLVERRMVYWWGAVREALNRGDTVTFAPTGLRLPTASPRQKRHAYAVLSRHIQEAALDDASLRAVLKAMGVDSDALIDREALGPDEVKRLAADPLVSIGGHTTSHRALAALAPDHARAEIDDNRRFLAMLTGQPVEYLAYPYGDAASCGAREFALAETLGFKAAVTTRRGSLSGVGYDQRFALPRVAFSGGRESLAYLEVQRLGLFGPMAQAVRAVRRILR